MELSRKINLAAREVQFIRHVLPGASTTQIKRHTHEYLNGQTPESVDERTIFMSMFNDIEWKPVCTMPKKWKHLRPNSSQDVASWSPRQKIRGGTDVPTNLKENQILSHYRAYFPPIFPATEPLSNGQLRKRGRTHRFQGTFEKQEDSHRTPYCYAIYFCVYNPILRVV